MKPRNCYVPGYKISVEPNGWFTKLLWRFVKTRFVINSSDNLQVRRK